MRDIECSAPGVHVESLGAGGPLVLLHGFAMNGGLFAPLLAELARTHRVHVVDIPGHGRSPPLDPFELPRIVDAIDAAIDGADLTVLGWSLGGQIALAWALARPQRIRRLVLVATTPSFVERDGWRHAMSAQTLSRFGDELRASYRLTLQRFLALQVHGSEEGRATLAALRQRLFERGEPSPEALAAALRALAQNDLRSALAHIAAPTLVIAGDRDALVPLAATRELAAAMPNATHVTIEGAAHAPFLSHRRRFIDTVLSYVDD
ncbi:MAG TPA: pimeloyl-ACP methyl ester esterase BioH [Casimicrobiaceae bacterium]|nr:pimeloyl-ACP methyl ester esterase BioH [Casimicrobiaceae bacterium]